MDIDSEIIIDVKDFGGSDSFIRSASYGLNSIDSYIASLKDNSTILEVGGGALVLSAQLSKKYPSLKFITIEPHSRDLKNLIIYQDFSLKNTISMFILGTSKIFDILII